MWKQTDWQNYGLLPVCHSDCDPVKDISEMNVASQLHGEKRQNWENLKQTFQESKEALKQMREENDSIK